MVRVGTRLAALEMIQSGTTTFADMYYFEEEMARAARAAGLRGVLGETIIGFPVADAKTPGRRARAHRGVHQGVRGRRPHHPGARAALAVHAGRSDAASPPQQLADRHNVPILIHLAETEDEVEHRPRASTSMTPAAYLESIGFLGPTRARRARRLGDRRGHRHPEAAGASGVAQPREQHEAGERRRAGAAYLRRA